MEFNSNSSRIRKFSNKEKNLDISSVFIELANEYSHKKAQQVDPNQLEVGETIFDEAGEEFTVVEDTEGTTNKVLMPVDQQNQPAPEVKTVEDTELSTSYSTESGNSGVEIADVADVAQVAASKKAQEDFYDEEIDWDDIRSSAIEINAYAKQRNMQGLTIAVEEMTNIILSHMELPEDAVMPPMFARLAAKCMARKAKKMTPLSGFVRTPLRVATELLKSKGNQGKHATKAVEILSEFRTKEAVIKKLLEKDKDPNKSDSEQEWGLYTRDGSKLLGRHPSKEEAEKQEAAIEINKGKESKLKGTLSEFKKIKFTSKNAQIPNTSVHPDVEAFHEVKDGPSEFNNKLKEDGEEEITIGQDGFTDIMECIEDMVNDGYEVVDVILSVGEKYPRDQGMMVLESARAEGIL